MYLDLPWWRAAGQRFAAARPVILRERALQSVALLRKETCNLRHPMHLRHPVQYTFERPKSQLPYACVACVCLCLLVRVCICERSHNFRGLSARLHTCSEKVLQVHHLKRRHHDLRQRRYHSVLLQICEFEWAMSRIWISLVTSMCENKWKQVTMIFGSTHTIPISLKSVNAHVSMSLNMVCHTYERVMSCVNLKTSEHDSRSNLRTMQHNRRTMQHTAIHWSSPNKSRWSSFKFCQRTKCVLCVIWIMCVTSRLSHDTYTCVYVRGLNWFAHFFIDSQIRDVSHIRMSLDVSCHTYRTVWMSHVPYRCLRPDMWIRHVTRLNESCKT